MKIKILLILACTMILAGCAGTPPTYSSASIAAPDRTLAYQEKSSEDTSTLIVIRGYGYAGGACYIAVNINDVLAARLDLGESARFYVKPGEQTIELVVDPLGRGTCGFGQGTSLGLHNTYLLKDERKIFRVNILDFELLDE